MAEIKFLDDSTIVTCLNAVSPFAGTSLSNIAQDAWALSNSTGDLDNGSELDTLGDFELSVTLDTAATIGDVIADLYILPSVDDTNFPDADTTNGADASYLVGSFVASLAQAAQRLVIARVPLVPRKMRFLLQIGPGGTGLTTATTHTLKCKPYKFQSV